MREVEGLFFFQQKKQLRQAHLKLSGNIKIVT